MWVACPTRGDSRGYDAELATPIRHVFADQGFAGLLVDWRPAYYWPN